MGQGCYTWQHHHFWRSYWPFYFHQEDCANDSSYVLHFIKTLHVCFLPYEDLHIVMAVWTDHCIVLKHLHINNKNIEIKMSLYLKVWNYFLNIEKRESYFGKMKMKSTQGDQISDAKICHYSVRSLMIRTNYVPIRILDMNYRLIYITYYDWLVLAFDKDFIYI